jgi:hypothetical protein
MTSHKIVYLDQNYLSNMAKARLGFSMNKVDSIFWQSLFDDLKAAVLSDKIACPESEFQRKEARLDTRIEEAVGRIIDELSWGLEFNPLEVILRLQIEDAAYRFLGKTPPQIETWSMAFKSDPQAPVESRMEDIFGTKGRIAVSFSLPDEIIEQDRQRKLEFMNVAQELLNEYSNNPLDWSELILQSKRSLMDGLLGKTARESIIRQLKEASASSQLKALDRYNELVGLVNRLREIGVNTDNSEVMNFMESEELLNIPFVDINGSIWAAIGEYYRQGRKVQRGDFYDAPILAAVFPYCDIITTDRFMKQILVDRLHFDRKYKCEIFSAGKTDRQAFHKLIEELR